MCLSLQRLENYNPADVALSLCRMISYNIGQLAYLNAKRWAAAVLHSRTSVSARGGYTNAVFAVPGTRLAPCRVCNSRALQDLPRGPDKAAAEL